MELTYNATDLILAPAGFVLREPLRPFGPMKRRLYVHPDIGRLLDGADPTIGFPSTPADSFVARYSASWLVEVSLSGQPIREADMERLEGLDEVWAVCIRKPRPGWRIFGRFVHRDVFVGLRAYDRNFLGMKEHYNAVASQIPAIWDAEVGAISPLSGVTIGDYLSEVYRDADNEN